MTIQDWGSVGEIIGGIGVIITLVYLSIQIRQNTRQIRNEGHQAITDAYSATLGQLLSDKSLFESIIRGCQDWASISAFQQSQCHIFFQEHLMHLRFAFLLHDKEAIDDDVYQSIEDGHIRFMANPGNRVWWNMVGQTLVEEKLARLIDTKLAASENARSATTEAWAFFDPKNWPSPGGAGK